MSETPTERIRRQLGIGTQYRIGIETTIEDLINAKRKGIDVCKLVYGLTPEEYGHVYIVGGAKGYRVFVKGSVEEIERRLKERK